MSDSHFTSKKERYKLGRYLAQILRVEAPERGLTPDRYGRLSLSRILDTINAEFTMVTIGHVEEIVEKDPQHRFEIAGDLIRARTGHRYKVEIPFAPSEPPSVLFHGTSRKAVPTILIQGILPKGKSFVHLSSTIERAKVVGRRKDDRPIVLIIEAKQAMIMGVRFWRSGQVSSDGEVYLSDPIPAEFISPCCD